MARDVVVRPTGTSWGAVLDGWLATVGVAALLGPIVSLMLASWYSTRGYASAVPVLVAVGLAYLVGGYVAGRIAGYRTSWHGMMTAFFGLFVVLAFLVVDIASAEGVFGAVGRPVQVVPPVLGVALYQSADTFAFGGVLGILIAIFGAWLGGLLAPARIVPVAATAPVTPAPVIVDREVSRSVELPRPRERYRLLPSAGQKGGERADEVDAERTEATDRIQPS